MPSVNGAKQKWENNTDWDRVTAGYDRFLQESGEDNLQDAWESTVRGADYTGGVQAFLRSSGGVSDATVTNDYDWENQTLMGGANWANDAQSSDAQSKFESRTDSANADKWFDSYASSFGVDS